MRVEAEEHAQRRQRAKRDGTVGEPARRIVLAHGEGEDGRAEAEAGGLRLRVDVVAHEPRVERRRVRPRAAGPVHAAHRARVAAERAVRDGAQRRLLVALAPEEDGAR